MMHNQLPYKKEFYSNNYLSFLTCELIRGMVLLTGLSFSWPQLSSLTHLQIVGRSVGSWLIWMVSVEMTALLWVVLISSRLAQACPHGSLGFQERELKLSSLLRLNPWTSTPSLLVNFISQRNLRPAQVQEGQKQTILLDGKSWSHNTRYVDTGNDTQLRPCWQLI